MSLKVIIANPVSYKILPNGEEHFTGEDWMKSIIEQDYPDLQYYILGNDLKPEMREILYKLADDRFTIVNITRGLEPDQRSKNRKGDNYAKFATIRNMVLDYVLGTDAEYYVSVDSDIIVHPDMVSSLVKRMKDNPEYGMIGAIVNNTMIGDKSRKYPHAIYNFGVQTATIKRPLCKFKNKGEFFQVAYTGACMIMRMDMLRKHPDIRWGPHRQGEDIYMCDRIEEYGWKIGIDTSVVTLHQMDKIAWKRHIEVFNRREFI